MCVLHLYTSQFGPTAFHVLDAAIHALAQAASRQLLRRTSQAQLPLQDIGSCLCKEPISLGIGVKGRITFHSIPFCAFFISCLVHVLPFQNKMNKIIVMILYSNFLFTLADT